MQVISKIKEPENNYGQQFSFQINKINFFSHKIGFSDNLSHKDINESFSSQNVSVKQKKRIKKSEKKRRKKYITCNCKNSECLKLYCDCFSRNGYCSHNCKCNNCKNTAEFEEKRQLCIEEIRKRKPEAFISNSQFSNSNGEALLLTDKKFCNCKKTKCIKKYCDCFTSGVTCAEYCKCENCLNHKEKKSNVFD